MEERELGEEGEGRGWEGSGGRGLGFTVRGGRSCTAVLIHM